MAEELTRFDCPLDVMYLIHKGLSAEAEGVQKIIEEFEVGTSLHPFRLAFNSWASVLMFHADIENTRQVYDGANDRLPASSS